MKETDILLTIKLLLFYHRYIAFFCSLNLTNICGKFVTLPIATAFNILILHINIVIINCTYVRLDALSYFQVVKFIHYSCHLEP